MNKLIHDIPDGGTNPKKRHYFSILSQKLHENEEILAEGWSIYCAPLDLPMFTVDASEQLYIN